MLRQRPLALLLALAALAAVSVPAATATATGTARAGTAADVGVHPSAYGSVLVDGGGRALYAFTRERPGTRPACYGACAVAWPPLLTKGRPRGMPGVDQADLGSVRRRDGTRQVTLRGRPLYLYVHDTQPGQVTCQDVLEFGGRWLVLRGSGRLVR